MAFMFGSQEAAEQNYAAKSGSSAVLEGKNDMDKLKQLSAKTYQEQAVWFLNAFWDEFGQKEAENVWTFASTFVELDETSGEEGNELDEFKSHVFLEKHEEALTVLALRNALRDIDIDTNKKMSMSEYLIYRYKADWSRLVNAAQCDNVVDLDKAQELLKNAKRSLQEAQKKAKELAAALEELKREEKTYNDKKEDLEQKSQTGGLVSRNRAKNELEQLLGEDPLPLRRAKIKQEAAVRASDRALKKARQAFQEAEDYLEELKKSAGSGQGAIWWIDRELEESKKYLPQSRGGYGAR